MNENQVQFHDEVVEQPNNGKMEKTTLVALGAFVVYVATRIPDLLNLKIDMSFEEFLNLSAGVADGSLNSQVNVISIISTIAFWGSIICGIVAVKKTKKSLAPGKKLAYMAIWAPIVVSLGFSVLSLAINGDYLAKTATNAIECVESFDCEKHEKYENLYNCSYEEKTIICPKTTISDEQLKK